MELIGRDMSKFTSVYDYLVHSEIKLKSKIKDSDSELIHTIYSKINELHKILIKVKESSDDNISEIKNEIKTNYPDLIDDRDNKPEIIEKITRI